MIIAASSGSPSNAYDYEGGEGYERLGNYLLAGVRAYDPTTGTFLQRDPISSLGYSAYAYCGGDPVNRSDPSGRSLWVPAGTALGAAVSAAQIAQDAISPTGGIVTGTRKDGFLQIITGLGSVTAGIASIATAAAMDLTGAGLPLGIITAIGGSGYIAYGIDHTLQGIVILINPPAPDPGLPKLKSGKRRK